MTLPIKCCGQCTKATLTPEGDLCKEKGKIVDGCEPPCKDAASPSSEDDPK